MHEYYQHNGYLLKRDLFTGKELDQIEGILRGFHDKWMKKHREHYEKMAINSAYITHADALSQPDRQTLFSFIARDKLVDIARSIIPAGPAFMNTQLFFDPKNSHQKNYWHRDIQYRPDPVSEQKKMLGSTNVLHFRVPFADERGIELVPGTHLRWDSPQEFETRMKENGRKPSDSLPGGKAVPLKRGDLLVFSASMIHRGLYGGNRFAFDIIFSDADRELLQYVDPKCLPDAEMSEKLSNPDIFNATRQVLDA